MNPAPNRRGVTVQGNSPGPDEPAGRSSGQVVEMINEKMINEIMERKKWLKEAAVKVFGDIPKAYPFEMVYTFSTREVKDVIDTSSPILAEEITYYINFDDPFARYEDDEILFLVERDDGTVIECTPANFLHPDCISAYYRHSRGPRAALDYTPLDP
jgi:hypothetical protein